MPRLAPQPWRTLVRVFELVGFTIERQSGSHVILSRVGTLRPVVIPKYDEVGVDIIQANLRTAGLGRKQFFKLLGQV